MDSKTYSKFYQYAEEIIQMLGKKEFDTKSPEFYIVMTTLTNILENNVNTRPFANFPDLFRQIENLPKALQKEYIDITLEDLQNYFETSYFNEQNTFDFFFHVGNTENKSLRLEVGNGEILSYQYLPKELKTTLNKKGKQKLCFMHIKIYSSGENRARESIIYTIKRNMSVYKLLYQTEWYSQTYYVMHSPFDYYYLESSNSNTQKYIKVTSNSFDSKKSFSLQQDERSLQILSDITNIIKKEGKNLNEIETRISSVIDLFMNIEGHTPLNVRFLLCIVSLEALLISKNDRDYLGWKLCEKVSFLLGTSEFWVRTYHKIGADHIDPSHVPLPSTVTRKISENRRALYYKMRDLYDKRSGFAHGGMNQRNKITDEDYTLSYTLVRSILFILLGLLKQGYTHVSKRSETDKSYLDKYIEDLKYS